MPGQVYARIAGGDFSHRSRRALVVGIDANEDVVVGIVDDRQWTIARDYEGSGRHAKAEHLQKEAEKRYGVALLVRKASALIP